MSEKKEKKAVVLLSGGMDSATVASVALQQGFDVHALSFEYGQKARLEVLAAEAVAHQLGIKDHTVLEIALGQLGGSSLTGEEEIPTTESDPNQIPNTYVPARNTIFLSYALALAEVIHARDIFIGTNSVDYSGYPDCRPEFLRAFEKMANLATRAGIEGRHFTIHSPLQKLNKAEIIRLGTEAGVQFGLTVSCYQPETDGRACGVCESCRLRLRGFKEAGLADPAVYKNRE